LHPVSGPLDFGVAPKRLNAKHNLMTRSITAKQKVKKPMGRPPTGKTPMVGFRLEPEIRRRVELWAKKHGLKFSDAARQLLEIGLDHADT
jgi:hypothetical protein